MLLTGRSMASIRRTISPALQDRSSRTSIPPPHKPNHSSPLSSSSSSPTFLRRLLMAIFFLQNPSRKWWGNQQQLALKRSLLRFFLCFLLGFLLGLSPFVDLDDTDLRPHHFFFDSIRPPPSDSSPQRDLAAVIRPGGREIEILKSEDLVSVELEAKEIDLDPDPAPPKLLILVTPTYNRAHQAYYLSRLGQTLRLVPPPLLWIVVEMKSASMETAEILRRMGVAYRHIVCEKNSTDVKDRGIHQRNTALDHIERHHLDGIVYFADDDNIYTLDLFESLREIRRFGIWPVAMLVQSKNKATLEGPVCNGSQVIGWHTNEKSRRLRRFHVDMSGFAFNSTILWDPKMWRRPTADPIRQLDTVKEGFQETTFIEQVVEDESQMEGLPCDCSRIMNWHLHLEARHSVYPRGWQVSRNLDIVSSLR